jgi:hypothetical protein
VTLHALDSGMAVPEPPAAPEPTSPAPKGVVLAADADTQRLLTRVAEPARGRTAAVAPETRYDSIVQLFGAGQPLAPPIRVNGVVDHARFSADGRRVAAGVRSGGERLVVWDAGAASVLAEWALGDARLDAVRITRAGERVIYRLGDGSVWAWAWPAAPRRFAAGEAFAVDEVGQRIAVAAGGQVRFFGLDTLAERPPVLATAAEALAFSPDGRWLAAGAGSDGPVWVWQIDPPLRVGLVENLASGGELAFSRGGAALGRTNRGEHVATPWALQALIDAARQRLAQRQLQ